MAIIVPNTASIIGAAGSLLNTAEKWVWVGFVATPGASGSANWFIGASTAGCPLIRIHCPANETVVFGPFSSPCNISVAGISGGSPLLWLKQ